MVVIGLVERKRERKYNVRAVGRTESSFQRRMFNKVRARGGYYFLHTLNTPSESSRLLNHHRHLQRPILCATLTFIKAAVGRSIHCWCTNSGTADMQDICLEPTFKFLVCKLHGYGVHPTKEAIRRHLRGEDHHCRGEALRQVISSLTNLPLSSLEAMRNAQPTVDAQPIVPPLSHLRVLHGWSCVPCAGHFLTTSLEVVRRHAAATHGRRRGDQPLWEACEMQTFFSETKDRRYFRVAILPAAANEDTQEQNGREGLQDVQAWREKVDLKNKVTRRTNSCSSLMSNPLAEISIQSAVNATNSWASQTSYPHPSTIFSCPAQPLTFLHPFTPFAARYVRLPVARLDSLFKSNAFRTASEPLFDPSHVDSALSMHAVFPHSEEEPAFLNALLYSVVQTTNRGKSTIEGLSLQARIISLLNEKLSSPLPTLSPADIGAIMILKTTAYKTCDFVAHDTHTRGLAAALKACSRSENSLTTAAKRAVFWLDLCAAVLMGSKRSMSHLEPPQKVSWHRESCPELAQALPIGFVRHQHALPYDLLECVSDVVEFQTFLRMRTVAQLSDSAKYHTLEPMQASIESRLAFQQQSCRQLGVVAEACRLAVFMCCYCSWMETWNDSLIPCRLAERLLDLLEPTLFFSTQQAESVWLQRVDILLWLLLVAASVVELDQGHVEDLRSKQSRQFLSARTFLSGCSVANLKHLLQSALQDFIYSKVLLTQRCYGKEWHDLELFINACKS